MIKLFLEEYCSEILLNVIRVLPSAIVIAWIPAPISIYIVTALRAINTIRLVLPYTSKSSILETVFSIFRIAIVVTITYFIGTHISSLIGGYWGRFLAILCAMSASLIAHGFVLWISDILKGPPYFNHHHIAAPLELITEEEKKIRAFWN